AIQARRQPGSAFKPVVYIAALESGLTPATVVDDYPIEFPGGPNGKPRKPDNYDRKFRGPITLQQALEESINVVAVRVQDRIGLKRTIDVARRLGVESPLGENLSLALGTSELSLLELTSAYATLANQGQWLHPTTIRSVLAAKAKLLGENVPEPKQVLSPELAFVATQMLKGTIERGTGVAAKALGRPAAAKTGTTNDYSNAWFIGFTPQLATGVWVGYDRPRSLGKDETGSRVAVPIWTTFMQSALAGMPAEDFPIPEKVVLVPVDLDRAGDCTRPALMAFVIGTEPSQVCGAPRFASGGGAATAPPPHPTPPLAQSPEDRRELTLGHSNLVHAVTIADRHATVPRLALVAIPHRLHVDGDAVGRPHLVLPAVEPSDGGGVVVDHPEVARQGGTDAVRGPHDLLALLEERKYRHLHRRQLGVEAEHYPLLAAHLLLAVGVGHEGEEGAVHARRRLHHEGHDVLLALLVEVGQRLAAELGVLLEVVVAAVGDAHQLAPADG